MDKPDPAPVIETLKFLGKQLRTNQFRLKRFQREKKAAEKSEAETRRVLQQIKQKIQREIDAHPDIIRGFTGIEADEEE